MSHSWVPRNRSRPPCHQGSPGSSGPAGEKGKEGEREGGDSSIGMKVEAGLQVTAAHWKDLSGLWDTGLSPDSVWSWTDLGR